MDKILLTGQLKTSDGKSGCFYTVFEMRLDNGEPIRHSMIYDIKLFSPYDGKIVVEPAEPLTKEEVFQWLLNHSDY